MSSRILSADTFSFLVMGKRYNVSHSCVNEGLEMKRGCDGHTHNKLGVPESKRVHSGVLKQPEHAEQPRRAKEANLAETRKAVERKYGGGCT